MAVPCELHLDECKALLEKLQPCERRIAQGLLGTAIGDAVGLPFELWYHVHNRATLDSWLHWQSPALAVDRLEVDRVLLSCLRERFYHGGGAEIISIFNRSYSDDTAVTDLKMQAVAVAEVHLRHSGSEVNEEVASSALFEALANQFLAWAHGARGCLFQGAGGFTKGFLKSNCDKDGTLVNGGPRPWVENRTDYAATPEYVEFLRRHFHESGSWGNGAVMSLTPGAALRHMSCLTSSGRSVLATSHQNASALVAGELLDELLGKIYGGEVKTCAELRQTVLQCSTWTSKVLPLVQQPDVNYMYPLEAFSEFLCDGSASIASVNAFLDALIGPHREALDETRHRFGVFGECLRTAANYDDSATLKAAALAGVRPRERGTETRMKVRGSEGELVRFSQRGLNSVIIAIWAAAGARDCWEWLERVLYVGGDADTIGAVAGQIACPLLEVDDVCASYGKFVALDEAGAMPPVCMAVNHAAARRFFRRSVLFAAGRLEALLETPRLVDPAYEGLTDSVGTCFADGVGPRRTMCKYGERCTNHQPKHRAIFAHPGDGDFIKPTPRGAPPSDAWCRCCAWCR